MLPYKHTRAARALLLFTMFTPAFGSFALFMLPTAALIALWYMQRGKHLILMLVGYALAAILMIFCAEQDPRSHSFVGQIGIALGAAMFVLSMLSTLLVASQILRERVGFAKTTGLLLLAGAGALAPLIQMWGRADLGPATRVLGGMGPALQFLPLSVLAAAPALLVLPPNPEIEALARRLGMKPGLLGWQAGGLTLSRRGRLKLKRLFKAPIAGLFAAPRTQKSSRPLLGNVVLDQTLELSLPPELQGLIQAPGLLMEAVHGSGAVLSAQGLNLDRRLDRGTLRADPEGQAENIAQQLRSLDELYALLERHGQGSADA